MTSTGAAPLPPTSPTSPNRPTPLATSDRGAPHPAVLVPLTAGRVLAVLHALLGVGVALVSGLYENLPGVVGGLGLVGVAVLATVARRPRVSAGAAAVTGAVTAVGATILGFFDVDQGGFFVDEVTLSRISGLVLLGCAATALLLDVLLPSRPAGSRTLLGSGRIEAVRVVGVLHAVVSIITAAFLVGHLVSTSGAPDPDGFGAGLEVIFLTVPGLVVSGVLLAAALVAVLSRRPALAAGAALFAGLWALAFATLLSYDDVPDGLLLATLHGVQAYAVVSIAATVVAVVVTARAARDDAATASI